MITAKIRFEIFSPGRDYSAHHSSLFNKSSYFHDRSRELNVGIVALSLSAGGRGEGTLSLLIGQSSLLQSSGQRLDSIMNFGLVPSNVTLAPQLSLKELEGSLTCSLLRSLCAQMA